MGSSERGHGAGTARAAIAIQVEGSIGMGTALKGERDGTWGLERREQDISARVLRHPPTQAWLSHTPNPPCPPPRSPRFGLGSPPADRVLLASHLRLRGDASPGRRVKRDPTDWARGGRP